MTGFCTSVLKVHYEVLLIVSEFRQGSTIGEQRFKANSVKQMSDMSEEHGESIVKI